MRDVDARVDHRDLYPQTRMIEANLVPRVHNLVQHHRAIEHWFELAHRVYVPDAGDARQPRGISRRHLHKDGIDDGIRAIEYPSALLLDGEPRPRLLGAHLGAAPFHFGSIGAPALSPHSHGGRRAGELYDVAIGDDLTPARG